MTSPFLRLTPDTFRDPVFLRLAINVTDRNTGLQLAWATWCGAGSYGSGSSCTKCPSGHTTPGAPGPFLQWGAPTDDLPETCFAAACAGIAYAAAYSVPTKGGYYNCRICTDASKGGANSGFTIHPRTAIGAKTVAQCSACVQSMYMKGGNCMSQR